VGRIHDRDFMASFHKTMGLSRFRGDQMTLLKVLFYVTWVSVTLAALPCNVQGGEAHSAEGEAKERFVKDRLSLQFMSGVLFSLRNLPSDSPEFNYVQMNLRLGWMLNDPTKPRFLPRGSLETLFEISNSFVYEGFGDYLGGFTVLLRYNVLRNDWDFVPYFQVGAGIVYTDAYKDREQQAIGQAVEFTPQGSVGFHYLLGRDCSIDAEAMFHHISNAGLEERNRSINSIGGFLGFTYYFDR